MNSIEIKKQIRQIEAHNQMLDNSKRNNRIMLEALREQLALALAYEAKVKHGRD